jgi:hypothetical protein
VPYRKSRCPMRAFVAVEEGPGVLGPKELLQKGTCMPPKGFRLPDKSVRPALHSQRSLHPPTSPIDHHDHPPPGRWSVRRRWRDADRRRATPSAPLIIG